MIINQNIFIKSKPSPRKRGSNPVGARFLILLKYSNDPTPFVMVFGERKKIIKENIISNVNRITNPVGANFLFH